MNKIKVVVAMGGYSSEKEISLKSGAVVCDSLDPDKYEIFPAHILKDGWSVIYNGQPIAIDRSDFSFNLDGTSVQPDVIFNTIHGTPGEDGYMAAYWELIGIPQTSSDFYPAALSFNKRDSLSVLRHFGIHCANSYYLNKMIPYDLEAVIRTTGLPCFVKPNRAGSSYGVSKVSNLEDMGGAIRKAFEEDSEILVETALNGIEVSAGVFRKDGEIIPLPVTEIVPDNEFFDYEAKYLGQSQEITPARISEEETLKVQQEAMKVYNLLNLGGIARADFIIQEGVPFFIEVNTTPGLSKESIVPQQAVEAGMTLTEFFDVLIEEALRNN